MPIIVSGALQFETIHEIGKDAAWVYQLLKKHHLDLKDVFYAFYKDGEVYIIRYQKDQVYKGERYS